MQQLLQQTSQKPNEENENEDRVATMVVYKRNKIFAHVKHEQ